MIKITDNSGRFVEASTNAVDRSLARMAIDIERLSKEQVPHDKGQLKASGHHKRVGLLKYRVMYNKEYALYQHEGMRANGTHVIKRHSKPGKKTHYLVDPAMHIVKRKFDYLKQEVSHIRI